jgi:hypothetical protein
MLHEVDIFKKENVTSGFEKCNYVEDGIQLSILF